MTAIHAMTGPMGSEDGLGLDDVARQAADLVRPGLACTVTLREFRCLRVAGASDARARRSGAVEHAEQSGPGLAALDEHRVVVMAEIARTRRWPAWRDVAVRDGFRTAVAIAAPVGPGVDVAVELLGEEADAWQRDELRRATTFAAQVARTAALQLEVARLRSVTEELYGAFSARDTIGQATGIVMSRRTCGPDEALAVLHRAAEHRNLSLRDVAAMVVGEMARADQIGLGRFADPLPLPTPAAPTTTTTTTVASPRTPASATVVEAPARPGVTPQR
jgi:hypothetical protein